MRVCHVCKINKSNDGGGELLVGKPQAVQKMISVKYDNDAGLFSGLPTVWRELLEMPLTVSKEEVITDDWDPTIAPVRPNQRMIFKI